MVVNMIFLSTEEISGEVRTLEPPTPAGRCPVDTNLFKLHYKIIFSDFSISNIQFTERCVSLIHR